MLLIDASLCTRSNWWFSWCEVIWLLCDWTLFASKISHSICTNMTAFNKDCAIHSMMLQEFICTDLNVKFQLMVKCIRLSYWEGLRLLHGPCLAPLWKRPPCECSAVKPLCDVDEFFCNGLVVLMLNKKQLEFSNQCIVVGPWHILSKR